MLCLLPAALPSSAEGGGCVCSSPLTTKDIFKMHARRRIRADPSLLSFVQEEEGSIALGYWSLGSLYYSQPTSLCLPLVLCHHFCKGLLGIPRMTLCFIGVSVSSLLHKLCSTYVDCAYESIWVRHAQQPAFPLMFYQTVPSMILFPDGP